MKNEGSETKTDTSKQVYEVPVDGEVFVFTVTRAHFSRFLRERERDPDGAANNLLMATVASGQKDKLSAVIDEDWVLPAEISGKLIDSMVPTRNLTVKKR